MYHNSSSIIVCGHPVDASEVRKLLDIYKRVLGKTEAYQVKKAFFH